MEDLLTKEEVNFRSQEAPGVSCASCSNFVAPDTCLKVEGKVDEEALCDLYTPIESDPADLESFLFGGVNG